MTNNRITRSIAFAAAISALSGVALAVEQDPPKPTPNTDHVHQSWLTKECTTEVGECNGTSCHRLCCTFTYEDQEPNTMCGEWHEDEGADKGKSKKPNTRK